MCLFFLHISIDAFAGKIANVLQFVVQLRVRTPWTMHVKFAANGFLSGICIESMRLTLRMRGDV